MCWEKPGPTPLCHARRQAIQPITLPYSWREWPGTAIAAADRCPKVQYVDLNLLLRRHSCEHRHHPRLLHVFACATSRWTGRACTTLQAAQLEAAGRNEILISPSVGPNHRFRSTWGTSSIWAALPEHADDLPHFEAAQDGAVAPTPRHNRRRARRQCPRGIRHCTGSELEGSRLIHRATATSQLQPALVLVQGQFCTGPAAGWEVRGDSSIALTG
mmetsp:Transcript_16773/g.28619  ORF Transcript_16773/g.28619 Transcript_16773/m.28619 type:complete len:216 (-) Transcript_16773:66-713(-)